MTSVSNYLPIALWKVFDMFPDLGEKLRAVFCCSKGSFTLLSPPLALNPSFPPEEGISTIPLENFNLLWSHSLYSFLKILQIVSLGMENGWTQSSI